MKSRTVVGLAALLLTSSLAVAQTLTGTVTNATSGKPAANVEVTLISLGQGMSETAHTRTDRNGAFSFDLAGDTGMPHLVRATYQDVNYFKMAPPGFSTADVQIYDAAAKLDGVATTMDVFRLQSDGSALQVLELYAVQNSSRPPRTLAGEHTFEIALPEGATMEQASARAPNGQPINAPPTPVASKKNHFSFSFPLRPGETQFEISYHLPYSGQATLKPVLLHDVQHFVAMLPKSMQLSASGPAFQPMASGDNGSNTQVATNVHAGDAVALNISGTGMLTDENAAQDNGQAQPGMSTSRGPGGGLGRPIDTPDPLTKYRWPLLGALAAVLAAGGAYIATRRAPIAVTAEGVEDNSMVPAVTISEPPSYARPRPSLLMEAMKEELFQLELDRQQGRVSPPEYNKAKAALDETIRRALARKSQ